MRRRDYAVYAVRADNEPHIERVQVRGRATYGRVSFGKCAVLYRFGKPVASFVITPAQERKIRLRRGTINVTEKSIERASAYCKR